MRKFKILIVIILIIIVFLNRIELKRKEYKINLKHQIITEEVINNSIIPEEYLGYIEIKKYQVKRLIKDNTLKKTLDEGFVGMYHMSSPLDSSSNIILAGHNQNNIFLCLHKINKEDEIKIITNNGNYTFRVLKKIIIDDNDYSYFNKTYKKTLTLITCTNNIKKRLLVIAQ